jgi:predicted ABC-type ATPase
LIESGAAFFNPDEAAGRIAEANLERLPRLTQTQINSAAWNEGRRLLERAIAERADFAFETTLGGTTIPALIERAADQGLDVHVWFVGLTDVSLHIARVQRRVAKGGHAIAADKIRERFELSRRNLIRLLPRLRELYLYDNSAEGDPDRGIAPSPQRIIHCRDGRIVEPTQVKRLGRSPQWAKPIVAAAMKLHLAVR